MEEIDSLEDEDIIKKEFLKEYRKGINFFSSELFFLNTNIYILGKIKEFPFDLLCDPFSTVFFPFVGRNFFYSSVLTICKLSDDTKGSYALSKFRDEISEKFIKKEYQQPFHERLKKASFDTETNKLLEKAKKMRNKILAHSDKELIGKTILLEDYWLVGEEELLRKITSLEKEMPYLEFRELESLKDKLDCLFTALLFNTEYPKLPNSYADRIYKIKGYQCERFPKGKPDIEQLLDCFAKNSRILNLPEEPSSSDWGFERAKMLGSGKLESYNELRKRFGFPEV